MDLVSLSAHKMYGPKGVGALYVRRKPRVRLVAQMDGGGHERGLRSGTLNVPGIVGFGKAAALALAERETEAARVLALREKLRKGLLAGLDLVTLNGSLEHRVPGNLNVSFAYVEGEALMMAIKDVAVSSGSACTSASPRALLRAARHGGLGGSRALVDPLRPRPLHHRGGDRPRDAPRRGEGEEAPRHVAACTRW